jgi:hypothetical protein
MTAIVVILVLISLTQWVCYSRERDKRFKLAASLADSRKLFDEARGMYERLLAEARGARRASADELEAFRGKIREALGR